MTVFSPYSVLCLLKRHGDVRPCLFDLDLLFSANSTSSGAADISASLLLVIENETLLNYKIKLRLCHNTARKRFIRNFLRRDVNKSSARDLKVI